MDKKVLLCRQAGFVPGIDVTDLLHHINMKVSMILHPKKILWLPVFFFIFATGCSTLTNPPRQIAYYSLDYTPPKIEYHSSLPYVLRVMEFSTSPFYDSNRIVYWQGPFRRQTYNYYKWLSHPGDMATHFLKRDLMDAGFLKGVFLHQNTLQATHVLEGSVEEFYEKDEENQWYAVLALNILLMEENQADLSKKVVLQKRYQATKPLSQKHPESLADSMSLAFQNVSETIMEDIYQNLSKKPRP